jgi:hypothetical protein
LSARPRRELSAFYNDKSVSASTVSHGNKGRTEHVLWIAATVAFGGMVNLRGVGSLLRNFGWTVGRPRGANDGLGGRELDV